MAYRTIVDRIWTPNASGSGSNTSRYMPLRDRNAAACPYGGPTGQIHITYASEAPLPIGGVDFNEVYQDVVIQRGQDDNEGGLRFQRLGQALPADKARDGVGIINYAVGTYQFRFPYPCREGSTVYLSYSFLEPFSLEVLTGSWENDYDRLALQLRQKLLFTRQDWERWEQVQMKKEHWDLTREGKSSNRERLKQLKLSLFDTW